MVYRLILPDWAKQEMPTMSSVLEGEFPPDDICDYNEIGYNIYYLPNYPSHYEKGTVIDGSHIDTFEYLFVDMDLKEGKYKTKDDFISKLGDISLTPTRIVDSGNGIHAYWRITDLDAMSFLKLQRRLMRQLETDEAVCKIYQLMRVPDTLNTKDKDNFKECKIIYETDKAYVSSEFDSILSILPKQDEDYCIQHFNRTYNKQDVMSIVTDILPVKFCQLLKNNKEIKEIWSGNTEDRSKSDYRIGHILLASGFTKEEATQVLVNTAKAMQRAPIHRLAYANSIIDKIWVHETQGGLTLSTSVRDILQRSAGGLKGTRFPCWPYIDATHHGFRLGQVIGLVAGSGVGKTAMALNMFMGFVNSNPDYQHFFIPLEQQENEIADRWKTMCGGNEILYDKVHIISNYDANGTFRNLSFSEIKDYILQFQKITKKKVGCVVIDHIGALKKQSKDGENQDLMSICQEMKAFAVETNTMLIMQSQTSREKAGIGDIELDKDAAYGTIYFESFCDYLITIWQPLKRCYAIEKCPTVTSFKFCKIRHKKVGLDNIKEDVCYNLFFDPKNELMRELTQEEETSFKFFAIQAVNKRKMDRKTEIVPYQSIDWTQNGKAISNSKS